MDKKSLNDLITENMIYHEGTYRRDEDRGRVSKRDLVGEYNRSRMFARYLYDLNAVKMFARVFGGFVIIMKTARGVYGYHMCNLGRGCDIKFVFVEPTVIKANIKMLDILYITKDANEAVDQYRQSRGTVLCPVWLIEGFNNEAPSLEATGRELIEQVHDYLEHRRKVRSYVSNDDAHKFLHECKAIVSKTGNMHMDMFDGWKPSGWCVPENSRMSMMDAKGGALKYRDGIHKAVCIGIDETLPRNYLENVWSIKGKNKHVHVYVCDGFPEQVSQFKKAFEEAQTSSALNVIGTSQWVA